MLSRVWTVHPKGRAGNERPCARNAWVKLPGRRLMCGWLTGRSGAQRASSRPGKANLLMRTIGSLIDRGHGAQVFLTSLCRPPGRCRFLPGKLAVKGLPGAERRDAETAGRSALDRELSRRQDARRGRTARLLLQAGLRECVTARGRASGGCGVTALRQRPAPGVPTLRQRARLPPHDGETPR